MMKYEKTIIFLLVLIGSLGIKESTSAPVQDGENVNDVEINNGTDVEDLQDDEILSCVLQVMSGKSISEACKQILISLDSDDSENKPTTSSTDLQDELQGLSAQSRDADPGYDVAQDALTDEKRTGSDENTFDDIEDQSIDLPFVTSFNDSDNEFVVIPMNYLKAEIGFDEDETTDDVIDSDVTENELPFESTNNDVTVAKDNVEDNLNPESDIDDEVVRDNEVAEIEDDSLGSPTTENEKLSQKVDILHKVELDIIQLGKDLKTLEEKDE